MSSETKVKTRKELLKELDRLTNIFADLTKMFRKHGDIAGLEEDFSKAQEDLRQFWKDFHLFKRDNQS